MRKEYGARFGYQAFTENEKKLSGLPIQAMSQSTFAFTQQYDFEKNKNIRESNFYYLHILLNELNAFPIDITACSGPLCFPFLPAKRNPKLKQWLIEESIFIPTYWPAVKEWLPPVEGVELDLVDNLLCIPVDQRYSVKNMDYIVQKIRQNYGKN